MKVATKNPDLEQELKDHQEALDAELQKKNKELERKLKEYEDQLKLEVGKRHAAEKLAGGLKEKLNPRDPILKISSRQLFTELTAQEVYAMLRVPAIADAAKEVLKYAPRANRNLPGMGPAKKQLGDLVKGWVDDVHEKSGRGRTNYLVEEISPTGKDSVNPHKEDGVRITLKHKASVYNAALPKVNVSKDGTPRWRRIHITIKRYQLDGPALL